MMNDTKKREYMKNYLKEYKLKHPEYQIKSRARNRRIWLNMKIEVFTHYFGEAYKCERCGINDIRVLQMHHENGGGNDHRKELTGSGYLGGMRFYKQLKRMGFPPIDVGCYCGNCHTILRFEAGDKEYASLA